MNQLRPNNLLASLIRTDEHSLFGNLVEFNADKHTRLQRAGEQIEHVYFPLAGMISLLTVMTDGVAVETAAIGYDSAAGFNGALSGRNSNCEAIVQISMKSLRIARRPFLNAYESSPGVRRMIHLANEMLVEQIQQLAACHALHHAEGRLARWLLQSHDYAGADVLDLTQDFVSEMIGVRRTTVTELAKTLQKEGLIKYSRGRVTIFDRAGLEKRCCECYRSVAKARALNPPLKPPSVAPSQA
jgi:CRP-like cAMP-binding protein